jgi:TRAP transporter TAXI family solute receptor
MRGIGRTVGGPGGGTWGGRSLAVLQQRLVCALALVALLGGLAAAEDASFFRIGTAGTTGTYFQIGGMLANAISNPPGSPNCQRGGTCGVPGLIAVAQATQGSVENVGLIGKEQLESALAQADVVSWAYHASGPFKGRRPIANLRAIAALYPESMHLVVLRDGPIRSVRDLKGRPVGVGEKESGTLADARLVLAAAGLGERDIMPDFSRLGEAAAKLREHKLDAFFLFGGYPVPAVAELAASVPIRLVPIEDELLAKLEKRYPYFSRATIPADAYQGLAEDTPTLGVNALWITGEAVPEPLIYAVTRSLWNDATHKLLAGGSAMSRKILRRTALDGIDIPLHPGAERYYREIGMITAPPAKD